MADVAISSIAWKSGPKARALDAGATIVLGDCVYVDTTDNKTKLGDADVLASAAVTGLAAGGATNGNPVNVYGDGTVVTLNGGLTKGQTYYLSPTAGKICLFADLSAGDYPSIVGHALSTTDLLINIANLGVAI